MKGGRREETFYICPRGGRKRRNETTLKVVETEVSGSPNTHVRLSPPLN